MMKCKICGQAFQYHVPNSHLETHGITRAEYNKLPGREFIFKMHCQGYNKAEDDATAYVIEAIMKNKKKNNEFNKARY